MRRVSRRYVLVPSSATAFAPLSQNSIRCRLPGGAFGHPHPGQSNPAGWLMTAKTCAVRVTPILATVRCTVVITAGLPAAQTSGGSILLRHAASVTLEATP